MSTWELFIKDPRTVGCGERRLFWHPSCLGGPYIGGGGPARSLCWSNFHAATGAPWAFGGAEASRVGEGRCDFESQIEVDQNHLPLDPKAAHDSFKVAHDHKTLASKVELELKGLPVLDGVDASTTGSILRPYEACTTGPNLRIRPRFHLANSVSKHGHVVNRPGPNTMRPLRGLLQITGTSNYVSMLARTSLASKSLQ